MRITTLTILGVFFLAPAAFAGPGDLPDAVPSCNWGELTSTAITEEGFDQGTHAADPSGDGLGPEDRVGLPNLGGGKGDLVATCQLVDGILHPD